MSEPAKHLVKLIGFPYETGAAHVVAALDAVGIRSVTDGTATAGFRAEAPGEIRVMIAERDLERAKKILEEAQQETSDIDWSQIDVGEPEEDV